MSRLVAIDIETRCPHGLKRGAINWRPGGAAVVGLAHYGVWGAEYIPADTPENRERIRRCGLVLAAGDYTIIGHNLKFDLHLLCREFGWPVPRSADAERYDDTMLRASLICGGRGDFSLDAQARDLLGTGKTSDIYRHLADRFGGEPTAAAQAHRLADADPELLRTYAIRDVEITRRVWEAQEAEIDAKGLRRALALERAAFVALFDIEHHGVPVSLSRVEEAMETLSPELARLEDELGFNADSPKQLAEAFGFEGGVTANGSGVLLTEKGAPSFGKSSLDEMTHPDDRRLAERVLRVRKLRKLIGTFLERHIKARVIDGHLYPKINQLSSSEGGTYTGRLSYTEPALQQIPSRDKSIAEPVRRCFTAPEGHTWVCGDLSQIELRIMAHYANVPDLKEAFNRDPHTDIHTYVAREMGIPRDNKEAAEKGVSFDAKALNFALVFGAGAGLIAQRLGLPYTIETGFDGRTYRRAGGETYELLERYDKAMPGVREAQQAIREKAKRDGCFVTVFGRRITVNERTAYASAGNIYQATAADLNKIFLIRLHRLFEGARSRLCLTIHDEYHALIANGEEHLIPRMQEEVERINDTGWLSIPITISFEDMGESWWDAISG